MNSKPSHCPFCGAHGSWLVEAQDYFGAQLGELSEGSRKNLIFTYELEVRAARIYHCISRKSDDRFMQGMFKAIAKVELEHAELVGKLIGQDPGCEIPYLENLCSKDRKESLQITGKLEAGAIDHYTKFLHEAIEPRVQSVFQALLEAENDHLALVKANLKTDNPGGSG
ncbi:MAG: ferritin [Deltaproteobacteria bacterium]|nr:ferritin [Deltaproteobacteria bacterium]